MTDKASTIVPPRLKSSLRNLQLVAVTTSSVAKQLSDSVRYRYVRLKFEAASTETLTFCFGVDNTIAVDRTLTGDQASTTSLGWTLAGGSEVDFELGGADNYIAVQGSATGNLRILGSGPKIGKGQSTDGP